VRRSLESIGLLRVEKTVENGTNLLCLTRHYDECMAAMRSTAARATINVAGTLRQLGTVADQLEMHTALAERVQSALRSAPNRIRFESELRELVGLRGNPMKNRWHNVVKLLVECGVSYVQTEVDGRKLRCMQLTKAAEAAASLAPTAGKVAGGGVGGACMVEDTVERQVRSARSTQPLCH
jgi:hypothetical protein